VDNPLQRRIGRVFDVATFAAALITGPVILALAFDDLPGDVRDALKTLNWVLWAVFAIELATMVVVTRDPRGWIRRRPVDAAIVLLTLPFFAGLDLLRLVRLIRGRAARRLAEGVTSAEGLRNVALLTLITVGLGGVAFAEVEPGVDVGDGIYWAVTTVTTTGYGDIVPTTEAGKGLAMYVMLIGAAFLAVLTGAIAQRFIGRWRRDGGDGDGSGAAAATGGRGDDAVLVKLDELGERIAQLERAVTRQRG
jgi:voltage-gated potassium channel